MSGKRKLKKSVKKFNKAKEDIIIYVPALLGLAIGGSKKIAVPTRNGFVYARIRSDLNEVVQAYNDTVPLIYNLPIILARNKTDKTKWYIVGRDIGRYSDWGTSSYVPDHHGKHQFDPNYPGNDIVWIYDRQFMPHLIYPSGTGAGCVLLYPHAYYSSGTWSYSDLQATSNLLTYKPTGTSARIILIYMDYDDTAKVLVGSHLTESLTGTASIITALPAMPTSTADPIGAIRLVSGTSNIGWNNIYDLRQFHSRGGGGGSGTDELVKISSNDTTAGYLNGKLIQGAGISLTENNNGGNETLSISYTGTIIDWDGSLWTTLAKPTGSNTLNDEFDDKSLNVKWTEWDVAGVQTVIEQNWGLELINVTGTALAGIYQPLLTGTAYTAWTKVCPTIPAAMNEYGVNVYILQGILLGEDIGNNPNTSGALLIGIWVGYDGITPKYAVGEFEFTDYNSVSIGGGYAIVERQISDAYTPLGMYIRVRVNPTVDEGVWHTYIDASADGVCWQYLFTVDLSFLPKEVGLGGYVNGNFPASFPSPRCSFPFFRLSTSQDFYQSPLGNRIQYELK